VNAASPADPSVPNVEIEAERRRAFRILLRNPLLAAAGDTAKDYMLVRRHSAWLRDWLARFAGWSLHVDTEVVRLRKIPSEQTDKTRPVIDQTSGIVFSKRRYALLCLALSALEASERQTTLGKIAETIMGFIAADPRLQAAGLVFDIANYDQRRDLVHAVRFLIECGLLRRIHGDEILFLTRSGAADALYNINRPILAVMLHVTRSPSALEARGAMGGETMPGTPTGTIDERVSAVMEEPLPATEEARHRRIRFRLVRALLDDPILYFDDLDPQERTYFQSQRAYLLRQVHEATGLIPELRREGVAMVDDAGDLAGVKLPEEGTNGHVTLLLAEGLAAYARTSPGRPVGFSAVEQHVATLIRIYGERWRKDARAPGAETRLAEETLERLVALRLVRTTADGVVPMAAIGRYALDPVSQKNL